MRFGLSNPPYLEGTETEVELTKDELLDEQKPVRPESKLYSYPADFTLEVLSSKLEDGEIVVPPFQRRYVWTLEKASMLIESFLRSLPVPPVYLFTTDDGKLLIVDGHQRLQTIRRFFDGTWSDGEDFKLLLDETSDWNGKSFHELPPAQQRKIKVSVMRTYIIEKKEGSTDNAMYDMFQRLNTGGVLLTPQEIRNCVYHGPLNDALLKLNSSHDWRLIVGSDEADRRQRDVELILRGLALGHIGKKLPEQDEALHYKPSLRDFLDSFMKTMQNPTNEWLDDASKLFSDTISRILEGLGERPFHLRRSMNAPTYDAVFVAFARSPRVKPESIKTKYERLKANNEFRDFTEERPTGTASVNGRIELAERILFGR